MNATTVERPVAWRATLSAASTALAPVGPVNCSLWSSPRGASTSCSNASMNARFAEVAMSSPWMMPSRSRYSMSARVNAGLLCP